MKPRTRYPGYTTTLGPLTLVNGEPTASLSFRLHRTFRIRMWIGGRLMRLGLRIMPQLGDNHLSVEMQYLPAAEAS